MVNVIELNLQRDNITFERIDLLANQFVQPLCNCIGQDRTAELGTTYEVVGDVVNRMPRSFGLHESFLAQVFDFVKSDREMIVH
jgi:hypothetical protein